MVKDENNQNLQLKADRPLSYPTVRVPPGTGAQVGGGREMPPGITSMTPLKKVPSAAGEQVRGNPTASGQLKIELHEARRANALGRI